MAETNGQDPVVRIRCGQIRGKLIEHDGKRANMFLAIPFAQPPIGELRFKRPLPPVPWSGVLETDRPPPQCPQKHSFKIPFEMPPMGEDCLYLGVCAPQPEPTATASALLPVMVFVHGGAFVMGAASFISAEGICRTFVLANEVIVVTIQYRLGVFGFFSTGDDACDDNLGLWDQTMALQWVQENIDAFGGDRQNVTVFGVSAGGVSVDLLTLSPHSRDLFHKVIPMSGNANAQWALHEGAVQKSTEIARTVGIDTADSQKRIQLLRGVPAQALVISFEEECAQLPKDGTFACPLGPRFDAKFFPKPLDELRAEAAQKPRIVGVCRMEGLFYPMLKMVDDFSLGQLKEIIARQLPPDSKYAHNVDGLRAKALEMFLPENGECAKNEGERIERATFEALSDCFVGIATQQNVNEQIALGNGAHTYLYSFDHCNAGLLDLLLNMSSGDAKSMRIKESTHGCDQFYMFRVDAFAELMDDRADRQVSRLFIQLWANFAKHGFDTYMWEFEEMAERVANEKNTIEARMALHRSEAKGHSQIARQSQKIMANEKKKMNCLKEVEAKLLKMNQQLDRMKQKETEYRAEARRLQELSNAYDKLRQMRELVKQMKELLVKMKIGQGSSDPNLINCIVFDAGRIFGPGLSVEALFPEAEKLRKAYEKTVNLYAKTEAGLGVQE